MHLLNIILDSTAITSQFLSQTPPEEVKMDLLDLAMKGGWIMIPIVLLSVVAIFIYIEKFFAIRKAAKEDKSFMDRIRDYIHDGKIEAALNLCKTADTPYSRLVEKGITRLGRPMADVLVAIENVGNMEVAKLEKGLSVIATVAAAAPMIGFLGTVTGMVTAFFDMSNAGSALDIGILSKGIYEALVTTVAGLIVGIIALFLYNHLVSMVDSVVHKMEARTMDFMDLLNEPVA
ncbi:MAG: MotA/TolQ/ExbB proton channel family protein [Candidatus Azobacteroides sp.]|nr:MotA/TolQ/ExbB proton channel family protein [Candidatus Azobacteroides sp.]